MQTQLIELRSALSSAFAAAPRAPAYVNALQQLSAADRSLWLDPDHVLQAAEASGGLGAAAVQIEEQMMYAGEMRRIIVGVLRLCGFSKGFQDFETVC